MATPVARPASIDGCLQTWSEKHTSQVIRSETDYLTPKVRRRTTASILNVDAQVTLKAEQYEDFMEWFLVTCQAGVLPTWFKRPRDGAEVVLRFADAPSVEWVQANAFRVSLRLEQLPEWRQYGEV